MSDDKIAGFYPSVHRTAAGTPYFKEPGVALVSKTSTDISRVRAFLESFDEGYPREGDESDDLHFERYLDDPIELDDATAIAKFAGQLCYLSFGDRRSMNADAEKYIGHILSSGHGSVLEHVNFGFLVYGADRSFTHEQVRHRVGIGYSQVSQRYVDGKTLRFGMRPEFQSDDVLSQTFENRIDGAVAEYDAIAERLRETMTGQEWFDVLPRTDQRKRVNQAARACLPNETEAPILVTANARTWRHVIEQRASQFADVQIRKVVFQIAQILQAQAPLIFGDYTLDEATMSASTPYRKV